MRIEMRESFSINKSTIADLERFVALAKQEGATSDTPVQFSDHYSLHITSNIRSLYMFAVRDNIQTETPQDSV